MIELAVLFGLLPVAAASGWWLGRRRRNGGGAGDPQLSSNYFRGLNYLLNEQSDKAIEVFLKLAEVNQETVETHLALGNLFRRRGEVDKAIRFHKHIISRPSLTDEQRTQALLELGEDYMRAGLLDRAERLFSELVGVHDHSVSAIRHLLMIYQQEKDWEQAIEQALRLERVEGTTMVPVVAQLYCELAACAVARGEAEAARRHLRQARRYNARCARARLIEGDLAWGEGRWDDAAEAYRAACEIDRGCYADALDRLVECHDNSGDIESLETWLEGVVQRDDGVSPALALARLRARRDGEPEAARFMLAFLQRRPSVRGLEYLAELMSGQQRTLVNVKPELLRELVRRLMDGQPQFRCQQCGFSGQVHHWQCPSCRQWETTHPITGVMGE